MRLIELTKKNDLPILINLDQIVSIDKGTKGVDYTSVYCTDQDRWYVKESYGEIKAKLRQYITYT